MAHVKAEVLELACCHRLIYPLTRECNYQGEYNPDCCHMYGDIWETGAHCEYSKWLPRYIERNYKIFETEEHDCTDDNMCGCFDLRVGKAEYLCSYLEIDGHVYCDVRGEYTGHDCRISDVEDAASGIQLTIKDEASAMRLMGLKVGWQDAKCSYQTPFLVGFTPNEDGTCTPHISEGFIGLLNSMGTEADNEGRYVISCNETYLASDGVLLDIARSMLPHDLSEE